jgi:hypothetical protein
LSFCTFWRNFNWCSCIFLGFTAIFTRRRGLFLFIYTRWWGKMMILVVVSETSSTVLLPLTPHFKFLLFKF